MSSTTATDRPTIVLIHGGWHTPPLYDKFTSLLKAQGYDVHVPRLPSMNGARPPNADLYTDTALIRTYIEALVEAGRNVVVLMHSYGGQVGSNALAGLGCEARQQRNRAGGIRRLVYITAFALNEGESMMDMVQKMGDEALIPLAFDFADDGTVLDRDPKNLLVGPGPPGLKAELDAYVARFERWNGTAMYQRLEISAWRKIPVSYVCTTNDMTVPLNYQQAMIEKMRGEGRVVDSFELETGHCPQITMPQELADVVLVILSKE